MKAHWDEAKGVGTDWMPPFPEWDFRTIRERESRLACCWEYARSTGVICDNLSGWIDGPGGLTVVGNFICTDGVRFPEPWVLCGEELRCASERVEADESPVTVYSMKARKAFVMQEAAEALADGRDVLEVLDRVLLGDGLVLAFDFERCGTEAVLRSVSSRVELWRGAGGAGETSTGVPD